MSLNGIFVGLSTIDIIYTLDEFPGKNRKITARSQQVVAGGPATNAAITFAFLGGRATLVTPVGRHATSALIREECRRFGVELLDLTPESNEIPPISSIWVNGKGERSVVSINTARISIPDPQVSDPALQDAGILMVDGHAMEACRAWVHAAKKAGIPVLLDGGSWKQGTEHLLKDIDFAICSADFQQPERASEEDVIDALRSAGVAHVAITHGAEPIRFRTSASEGCVDVPHVQAVDTAGAGDVLHGAFCFYFSSGHQFEQAIVASATLASESCRYSGTRAWMKHYSDNPRIAGTSGNPITSRAC